MGDDLLRVAAARQQRHGAIARPPALDTVRDLDDLARALEPQDRRRTRRRRIVALALHQVGAVHAGGRDLQTHGARLESGRRGLPQAHHALVTGRVDEDRSQLWTSLGYASLRAGAGRRLAG